MRDYEWLRQEPAPRHLVEAVKTLGEREAGGERNNPTIVGWALSLGGWVARFYTQDSIPWCGLWMAYVLHRAERKHALKNPLRALDWAGYGVPAPRDPELSDILVFQRPGGGHVGLYVGEDATAFHVLGGNQGDRVSIVRIARARLVAARRPSYQLKPNNIRRIHLAAASGRLSEDEA